MSILSRLMGSKKPPADQKAKEASNKPPPPPYQHIPQHAARDSMNLGPSWSSKEDRRRSASIRTQNTRNRRSGITRNNSALSNVMTIHRDDGTAGKPEYTSTQDQRKSRVMFQPGNNTSIQENGVGPSPLQQQRNSAYPRELSQMANGEADNTATSPKPGSGNSNSSSSSSQGLEIAPRSHPQSSQTEPSQPNRAGQAYYAVNPPKPKPWEVREPVAETPTVQVAPQESKRRSRGWGFGRKTNSTVIAAH